MQQWYYNWRYTAVNDFEKVKFELQLSSLYSVILLSAAAQAAV
jgi:hypothetical protein